MRTTVQLIASSLIVGMVFAKGEKNVMTGIRIISIIVPVIVLQQCAVMAYGKEKRIVMTGIASDQCVFASSLDAADRGFDVIIAADACANYDPGSAEAVQILFGRVWGYVMQTRDIIEWLETGRDPLHTHLEA